MAALEQTALLCGCGALSIDNAGGRLCAKCERARRHDQEKFAGNRTPAMRRDGCCVACGDPDAARLIVHHRFPGRNALSLLVTLCRACHCRAHHTARPGVAFVLANPVLFRLWRELHPRQPVQLLLLPAAPDPAQATLFAAA